jgi:hypothetical protein
LQSDTIKSAAEKIQMDAYNAIMNVYNDAKNSLSVYQKKVVDHLETTASDSEKAAAAAAADIIKYVDGTIVDVVTPADKLVTAFVATLPTAAVTPASGLMPDLGGIVNAVSAIPKAIAGIGTSLALVGRLGELGELMHSPDTAIAEIKKLSQEQLSNPSDSLTMSAVKASATVGAVTGAPLGLLPILGDAYSAGMGESIKNIARFIWKPTKLGIAELATSLVRENITSKKYLEDAGVLGYTQVDAQHYLELTRLYLNINDVTALWLRGEMQEAEYDAYLSRLGMGLTDSARLKKLAYPIPQVNDLIHMAVREAFTPEIAEKFGQYEDYPKALTEWGEKQGLSKDWAQRYWAAHWELPSVAQGFEMYQRKIIDRSTLDLLLRALDVMPYWRDQLTKMAYQPITRVDIRRIHKMHLIDDTELQQRYEAIGYSPEDAAMLVKFTIELNAEEVKLEKQAERDLTAAEILNAYANVMLDTPDVVRLLSELGYDESEIALKMALAELPQLKRVRDKKVAIINQRLLYGAIDLNGAVDQLNALGMSSNEQDYVLADWQLDLELQDLKAAAAKKKTEAK